MWSEKAESESELRDAFLDEISLDKLVAQRALEMDCAVETKYLRRSFYRVESVGT